ncbi:MAG TPA: hypothetical protein VGQ83_19860 [Polyangia bacterium]|jgi:hypothetical protein
MSQETLAPGAVPAAGDSADGATGPADTDTLDLAFADLKAQLKDQVVRLRTLGRDVAQAAAARVEADAAIADAALEGLELDARKKRRRRAQVLRLERLIKRLSAVEIDPARGRRRDLKQVACSMRRIITALTEPVDR